MIPMSDKELLDWLASNLDGKVPFPEDVFDLVVRSKLRETGRACADPAPPAPDPEPSGY